jgi:hypothetical protein
MAQDRKAPARKSPKLTAEQVRKLPAGSFALPGTSNAKVKGAKGSYEMDTPGRARNALARGAQHATPTQQAAIRRNVEKKYPGIKVSTPKKKAAR